MPGGAIEENGNGGRVTIRELYNLILEQNQQRHDMERRIMDAIGELHACSQAMDTRITNNTKEIDTLRDEANRNNIIASTIAAIAGAVAGIIGGRQ